MNVPLKTEKQEKTKSGVTKGEGKILAGIARGTIRWLFRYYQFLSTLEKIWLRFSQAARQRKHCVNGDWPCQWDMAIFDIHRIHTA